MTMLKFRRLFLLLFFQCYLGYAIKGEAENDYHAIQSIENLDMDVSNASAANEIDLPEQKSSDYQSNETESLKTTFLSSRNGDHETVASHSKVTEDNTNKTINQSTNHTDTMFSKIGARGGKTGGSKGGGSKTKVGGGGSKTKVGGGGSKTKVGGGRGYHWRPNTRSSGSGGGGLTALWVILGIAGVSVTGFLVCLLVSKYMGSDTTEES